MDTYRTLLLSIRHIRYWGVRPEPTPGMYTTNEIRMKALGMLSAHLQGLDYRDITAAESDHIFELIWDAEDNIRYWMEQDFVEQGRIRPEYAQKMPENYRRWSMRYTAPLMQEAAQCRLKDMEPHELGNKKANASS